MAIPPVSIGLTVCDYVIIEHGTQKASLIGTFRAARVDEFPAQILPFSVFANLTNGFGDVRIQLIISSLEIDEEIYNYESSLAFPDKLSEVLFHLRVGTLVIPTPGEYQFTLLAEGEWVAQRRVRYYSLSE